MPSHYCAQDFLFILTCVGNVSCMRAVEMMTGVLLFVFSLDFNGAW